MIVNSTEYLRFPPFGGEAEQAQTEELDVLEVAPSVVLMLLTAALLLLSLLFYLGACCRLSPPPSLWLSP